MSENTHSKHECPQEQGRSSVAFSTVVLIPIEWLGRNCNFHILWEYKVAETISLVLSVCAQL